MESEQLIKAMYLTLMHSLWQGAAIAGLAGIVMMLTKRSSAASRYNFLTGSLIFFVLCAGVTFIRVLGEPVGIIPVINTAQQAITLNYSDTNRNIIDNFFSILGSYSNRIVLLWFLIICLKGLQLWMGFNEVENLKSKQTSDPGAYWTDRINLLSKKLGITQAIRFAESGLTMVPLTVGYLKPVILVPAGMLAAIPADQVEAIILHELAHIKRKDYFVNILQSIVEIFFFFNPAIWWLSSLIRAERENCCDDIAIENSSSKIGYVKALVAFEEYRHELPQLSLGFGGRENTLINRTKRIIYNQNNTLNSMEKFILTSGLVLSGLLSLAFTDDGQKQISKTLKPVAATISEVFPAVRQALITTDTIPASSINEVSIIKQGISTYNVTHNGKSYEIRIKEGKVTDLYINRIKIADDKIKDYSSTIKEVVDLAESVNHSAEVSKKDAETVRAQALQAKEISEVQKNGAEAERKKADAVRLQADEAKEQAEIARAEAEGIRKNIEIKLNNEAIIKSPLPASRVSNAIEVKISPAPAIRAKPSSIKTIPAIPARKALRAQPAPAIGIKPSSSLRAIPAMPAIPAIEALPAIPAIPAGKALRAEPLSFRNTALKAGSNSRLKSRKYTLKSLSYTPKVSYTADYDNNSKNSTAEEIGKMLINEGLIINSKKFFFTINNQELFVDGIKQNDNIHSRILSKLSKKQGEKINLTYSVN
jgi:bla regulator protein BlaR1